MEYVDLEWGERGEGRGHRIGTRGNEKRERAKDRLRFALAMLGALIGGGGALGLVHSTMSWVPNPGPMLPFSAFAGAVLGLFSAAYVGAALASRDEEASSHGESEATPPRAADEAPPTTETPSGELADDELLPPWVLEVQRLRGPQGRVAL